MTMIPFDEAFDIVSAHTLDLGVEPLSIQHCVGRILALRFLAGNAILYGVTFALGGALLCKGWLLVLGNLALVVCGVVVDRWARSRLATAEPLNECSKAT